MPCEFLIDGQPCGEESVTECFHCGALCRRHMTEPCLGYPLHVGVITESMIVEALRETLQLPA